MESSFYKKAAEYWSTVPPTLEGVLGGFGFISKIDINGSKQFLEELLALEKSPNRSHALDCGAGIGRITKDLLIEIFDTVDLVEQNPKFLEVAESLISQKNKLGQLYAVGLQSFKPLNTYDVIWCQWVLGHLKDNDLVDFFLTCKKSLNENGLIIVKENVTSSGALEKDDTDSSVTRPLKHLLSIFKRSKLTIVKEVRQKDFPKGIYPVYMFALRSSHRPKKGNEIIATGVEQNLNDTTSELLNNCTLIEDFKALSVSDIVNEEEIMHKDNIQIDKSVYKQNTGKTEIRE